MEPYARQSLTEIINELASDLENYNSEENNLDSTLPEYQVESPLEYFESESAPEIPKYIFSLGISNGESFYIKRPNPIYINMTKGLYQ